MPTTTTNKTIADMALGYLGQAPLNDFSEDSRNGRMIRLYFDPVRRGVLEDYPWSFATKRQELAPLSTNPAFGFDYQFALPGDFLKERFVRDTNNNDIEYVIEGELVKTNCEAIRLIYTSDIDDISKYSAKFVELFALKLAASCGYKATQSRTETKVLMNEYKALLVETMSNDSSGDGEPRVEDGTRNWLANI